MEPDVLNLLPRSLQSDAEPDLHHQVPTPDAGWGLMARQAIAAGAFVVCYNGEVLSAAEARRSQNAAIPGYSNYLLVLREQAARSNTGVEG